MDARLVVASVLTCLLAGGFLASPESAGAFVGQARVLVILGTWGPRPFSRDAADTVVFDETANWFARSSFGRMSVTGETTPWLSVAPAESCDRAVISGSFRAAAERAGYVPGSYTRIVYITPHLTCATPGFAAENEVFLIDTLSRELVVHELGHTFGLGHAKVRECDASGCEIVEYGDRYDTMGVGRGDFNAFEKFTLGWLDASRIPRIGADGVYAVEGIERPSTEPQALVIETADTEYWVDHREPEWDDESLRSTLPADNVFIRAGPPSAYPAAFGPYSTPNILVPAVPYGRQPFLSGERFVDAGAFELTVLGRTGTAAQIAFRWTDRTAPSRPRIMAPASTLRPRGPLVVTWAASRETGSGLARYELTLDQRPPTVIVANFRIGEQARLKRPARGRHTLRLVAVDRAGNRSAVAVRRFTIR